MRAVWYTRFGPAAEVFETGEVETPEPGPGEVRVRVAASGVNPVDVKRRAGGRGEMSAARVIPHFDGAGVIDRAGAGVSESRVGERVWLYEAQWGSDSGSAAEQVVLPAERAVPLPAGTSFAEGACLGIPALTAHRAVFGDGPVAARGGGGGPRSGGGGCLRQGGPGGRLGLSRRVRRPRALSCAGSPAARAGPSPGPPSRRRGRRRHRLRRLARSTDTPR